VTLKGQTRDPNMLRAQYLHVMDGYRDVFSSLSGHAPPYLADDWSPEVIDGGAGYAFPPTDCVPFHTHTTHSATGASLSPGHVFGTVFRPPCAMRTLHTTVSGVNSKRFVLVLLPGRNETFVNCAI